MPWVRLDDDFLRNRKMREVGLHGRALYIAGLCHCARELSDGKIDKSFVAVLAAEADVKPSIGRRLVEVGLWEDAGTAFVVHDYLTYNPSANEVRELRQKRSEAGRRGGSKSKSKPKANGQANASANARASSEQNRNPMSHDPSCRGFVVGSPLATRDFPPGGDVASHPNDSSAQMLVAGYVADFRASHHGSDPSSKWRAQAGRAAASLLADGYDRDALAACLGAIARENKAPSSLGHVLADYQSREAS